MEVHTFQKPKDLACSYVCGNDYVKNERVINIIVTSKIQPCFNYLIDKKYLKH